VAQLKRNPVLAGWAYGSAGACTGDGISRDVRYPWHDPYVPAPRYGPNRCARCDEPEPPESTPQYLATED